MATSVIPTNSVSDHSGRSGYLKMDDGTLIQWGSELVADGAWGATATFPLPFVNATDYQPLITWVANSADVQNTAAITKNADSMTISRIRGSGTVYFTWIAIGRWK